MPQKVSLSLRIVLWPIFTLPQIFSHMLLHFHIQILCDVTSFHPPNDPEDFNLDVCQTDIFWCSLVHCCNNSYFRYESIFLHHASISCWILVKVYLLNLELNSANFTFHINSLNMARGRSFQKGFLVKLQSNAYFLLTLEWAEQLQAPIAFIFPLHFLGCYIMLLSSLGNNCCLFSPRGSILQHTMYSMT